MFQFSGSPHRKLCIHLRLTVHDYSRVSPFGNLRVNWIFAPNRSLSQLITSFFGTWCQGIRPTLLLAWPIKQLCLLILSIELLRLSYSLKVHCYHVLPCYLQLFKRPSFDLWFLWDFVLLQNLKHHASIALVLIFQYI